MVCVLQIPEGIKHREGARQERRCKKRERKPEQNGRGTRWKGGNTNGRVGVIVRVGGEKRLHIN